MGIRGSRRHQNGIFLGREDRQGERDCNGCGSKWDNRQTSPVGSFRPNAFGLYDTAGDAWQWVQDCYHEGYSQAPKDGSAWIVPGCSSHVVRGGSWYGRPADRPLRLPRRDATVNRNSSLGFRVVRMLTP